MEKLTSLNQNKLIPTADKYELADWQKEVFFVADKYQLTDQQREVFFRRFIEKKTYLQIAKELETSENACQKCMGEVYKKFNITGETRGKERRLIQAIKSIIVPKLKIGEILEVKNFRLSCELNRLAEAEVTLWNPKTKKQFKGTSVQKGSINALYEALTDSLSQSQTLQLDKAYNFFLHWAGSQDEEINNDKKVPVTAAVIFQYGINFYVGKDRNEDTITAAFNSAVSSVNNLLNKNPIDAEIIANEVIGTGKIKIYGQARIEIIMKSLTKIFEAKDREPISISAVSSGRLISWWNSELGQIFKQFNKELIDKRKANIKRVFILKDKPSDEIVQIMQSQKQDGINVRYILEEDIPSEWPSLASINLLVCENITTRVQEIPEDGHISWDPYDIRTDQIRFDLIWEKAKDLKENISNPNNPTYSA